MPHKKRFNEQLTLPIERKDKEDLEIIANKTGTTVAQLVRTAIKEYLDRNIEQVKEEAE